MILQINKMYSPEIGGIETVVKDYSEYLKDFDDVIVLCVNKKFSLKTTIEYINGIKIYRCASLGTYMSMPVSIVFFFYLFFLSRKANFIHFHEPFPLGTIGSLIVPKTKKIFITWHSDIIKQRRIKDFFQFFQIRLCKKASKIISTSDRLTEFSNILKSFKDKVVTIPLSINENEYTGKTLVNNHIQNLPKNYVLFIGRFTYYKGVFLLLDAIEKINYDIPFVIVGNGDLALEIKKRIESINKNIILINSFVTDDEKKYLLKNSKFLVFPSIYSSEAFGIIQLESMIYGKPVINTDLPTGVPWVSIHNESGITVEPFNSLQLSNAIVELYTNEKLYIELSNGAYSRVNSNFVSSKTNEQLYKLYFR